MAVQVLALRPPARAQLVRRARLLAWGANAWHVVEFAVALGAGIAASSIALVGFSVDSLIEAGAGFVVLWRFGRRRERSERRARQAVAVSYVLLAAYVATESVRTFAGGMHPDVSWIGIALACVTAPTMPLLARAKRRVGLQLGSPAAVAEAGQNLICAYLSLALLAGLGLNALAGWWWADPAAALAIAAFAAREGRRTWQGRGCCDAC
jgi:divalent metal cation (Fe/Co/Zn/Cd) transporter